MPKDSADVGIISDGSQDWSKGVDSLKQPTVISKMNPNGLDRDQLAWLINGTVRAGDISQKPGWTFLGTCHDGSALFQGASIFQPIDGTLPYLIDSIGGHIYKRYADSPNTGVDIGAGQQDIFPPGTSPTVVSTQYFVTMQWTYLDPSITPGTHIASANLNVNGLGASFNTFIVPAANTPVTVSITPNIPPSSQVIVGATIELWVGPFPTNAATVWTVTAVSKQQQTVDTPPAPAPNIVNPPNNPYSYFKQAETFLIIQAGDYLSNVPTNPLFWDGAKLVRSKGITNLAVAPGTPLVNQIPPAGPMEYYMGRLWYAGARSYAAGDIVQGSSGTPPYNFTDALLNVTENPLATGGDGFTVPSQTGNITALKYNGQLDASFGQGLLYVFTAGAVYSLTVPITRSAWIAANSANPPFQAVVQLQNGAIGDRCIAAYNGDLFYKSTPPGIWSLINAIRYFDTWGNTAISNNETRILSKENPALLNFSSSVVADERLLNTALPVQTPQGVIHQAILPLDFTPLESFDKKLPPTWEGHWEGLQILQLVQGLYPTGIRTFAYVVNPSTSAIELWELTLTSKFDTQAGGNIARISTMAEFPSFDWGQIIDLKKLITIELWLDGIDGEVVFEMDWRPDSDSCWHHWFTWKLCTAQTTLTYPQTTTDVRTAYRSTITLPAPPKITSSTGRTADIGYLFQPRLTFKGACRIRGLFLHAEEKERKMYENMVQSYDPTQGKIT